MFGTSSEFSALEEIICMSLATGLPSFPNPKVSRTYSTPFNLDTKTLKFCGPNPHNEPQLLNPGRSLINLTRLELDHNDLGEDGALSLAETLKKLPYLNVLSLHKNEMGTKGGSAVASSLIVQTALEVCSYSLGFRV